MHIRTRNFVESENYLIEFLIYLSVIVKPATVVYIYMIFSPFFIIQNRFNVDEKKQNVRETTLPMINSFHLYNSIYVVMGDRLQYLFENLETFITFDEIYDSQEIKSINIIFEFLEARFIKVAESRNNNYYKDDLDNFNTKRTSIYDASYYDDNLFRLFEGGYNKLNYVF